MIASAAGSSRRVAIAFSTSIQGRQRPERDQRLGPEAVVEQQPGGQEHRPAVTATRLSASLQAFRRQMRGGSGSARCDAGGRGGQPHPHPGGADRGQVRQHRLEPVERRLGGAEEAEVSSRCSRPSPDTRAIVRL